MKNTLTIILLCLCLIATSQEKYEGKKVKISGKIIEKTTSQPLEYATITLINSNTKKQTTGGVTNPKGEFDITTNTGIYDIKIEFISFRPTIIKQKSIQENINLGTITLEEDASQLSEVVIRAEKSSVEIKLDKKVYNVGQDLTARGGTASDVLNNVPSVTVDSDGNVSLRGNDNVKILIDGRPSGAINIADALKSLSADSVDKVEVITNPSARYDAEGGAGILNIVLKKGKNKGINGTIITTVGNPKNYGISSALNFKNENFNLFTTIGYNDSKNQGNFTTNSDYLNVDGSTQKSVNERSTRERGRKGYNINFGLDWYLTKSLTWSNALNTRKNDGFSPENAMIYNYEPNNVFARNRFSNQNTNTTDTEYTTNFTQKFKKDGHKLTFDGTFSRNTDNDLAAITDAVIGQENLALRQSVTNYQTQRHNLLQSDYILPLGKNSQFEAGFKNDFNKMVTNYNVGSFDGAGNYVPIKNFTNIFEYKENTTAVYSQFVSKINKFSYLFGLRYENSIIDSKLVSTNVLYAKKYGEFFPSAFLTYQLSDQSSISLNYSRRIARPRTRFLAPFSGYTNNTSFFQGNPDINPSFTDAIDFGTLFKFKKVTLTTSLYYNKTHNPIQITRRPNGDVVTTTVNGLPVSTQVLISTPINLDSDNRYGLDCSINYSPFKWWKFNGNFNVYKSQIVGNYSYLIANNLVNTNVNKAANSWFTKISSRLTLPYKIDFQTNATYNAPQNTAQGQSLGVYSINLGLSKDVLKDKATLSLNVNDLLNSTRMKLQFNLPTINSYSDIQRRSRQINLSFTYRFNKQKSEKEKPQKKMSQDENGGGEF